MPKVPQLEQQIAPRALPGVREGPAGSAESYGAGVGDTLSRVGVALYEQESINADRTAVFAGDRQLADLQTSLDQKLQQARGKNVLGLDDALKKEWADGVRRIKDGLSNGRQLAGFDRVEATRGDQFNRAMQSHVSTEMDRYQDQETEAGVKSVFDRVRADPRNAPDELRRADSLMSAYAQRKGWMGRVTPDQAKSAEFQQSYADRGELAPGEGESFSSDQYLQKRTEIVSGVHGAVLNGYLSRGDDRLAKAYFDAHQHDLTAHDRQAFEKTVTDGSTIGEARRTVNGWITKGYNELKMLEESRLQGEKDPKLGALLREYSVQFVTDKLAAEKRVDERNFETNSRFLKERIASEPGVYHDPRDELGLDIYLAQPPHVQDYLDRTAKEAMSGNKPVTDLDTWVKVNAMKDDDLAKMTVKEITKDLLSLDEGDRDKLLTRWNGVLNARDGKKDVKYEKLLSNQQVLTNAMELSGFFDMEKPKTQWSTEHKRLWNKVENKTAEALAQIPDGAPLKIIQDTVQGVVDKEIGIKFRVDPGFFSRNKDVPAALIDEQKDIRSITVPMKEIPITEQDAIKGLLREGKKPISSNKIERIYALKRMQQAGKLSKQDMIDRTKQIIEE